MEGTKMKLHYLIALALLTVSSVSYARGVRGYVRRSTGTYVMPHQRTNPNRSRLDNWSHKGNYNPYTGKAGTKH